MLLRQDNAEHPAVSRPLTLVTGRTYDVLENAERCIQRGDQCSAWGYGRDPQWALGLSPEETVDLAMKGWRSGTDGLSGMTADLYRFAQDLPELSMVPSVYGPIWNMPAVIEDQPYCAYQFNEIPTRRLINITLNAFLRYDVDATHVLNRGKALAALMHVLNALGYATAVRAVYGVTNEGRCPFTTVTVDIQRPGEVLDLDRIMFWLGHPAAVRMLMFGASLQLVTGHESGCNWKDFDRGLEKLHSDRGDIFIPGILHTPDAFYSEAKALVWAKDLLQHAVDFKEVT